MSKDIKMFNACDHIVKNKQYDPQLCPKCYGKNYYLDIHFDINGETVLTEGSIKLQQEMLKIILDKKYMNAFHPRWGSEIDSIIGTKNINIGKAKLEVIIRMALEHLKSIQISSNTTFKNFTDDEILKLIEHVEITPLGPVGYNVDVTITNISGEVLHQSITL